MRGEIGEPKEIEIINGRLYFTAEDSTFHGPQLYFTDGSISGRIGLPNTDAGVEIDGSFVQSLEAIDDRLYFNAAQSLWFIDNPPFPAGDANRDNLVDVSDIDIIRRGIGSPDVNNDGETNELDVLTVLDVMRTKPGDANLDGRVGFDDFLSLANNFGSPGGWWQGDFDGNGEVDFLDFVTLANNFGFERAEAIAQP